MNIINKERKLTGPREGGSSRPSEKKVIARTLSPSLSGNCAGEQISTQACSSEYTSESDDINLIDKEVAMIMSELDTDASNSHSLSVRKRKQKKGRKRSFVGFH